MGKKRIMVFMGALNGGGAERVLVDTLNNLNPEKYDITLILLNDRNLYQQALNTNIHCRFLTDSNKPHQKKWFYRFLYHIPFQWVYRAYFPDKYDLEIAFLEGMATHVIGCSPTKAKKLAWVHTDMYENRWADVDYRSEKQQKNIYHRFDRILCVSKYCENQFKKRFGEDYPVSTIYNVVCDSEIRKKSLLSTDQLPEKHRFTLISSGRFTNQKGFDRLIKIHKRLLDTGYEHDLWLLGDGAMRAGLEEYVSDNCLQSSVRFLGFQSNPYPFMKSADCFVCSSRSEGYSTVVTEAFILGLPVVSVKCSGAEELLDGGKYGILTENDDEALYQGLKQILVSKQKQSEYKELAIQRGKDFSLQARISEFEELIDGTK